MLNYAPITLDKLYFDCVDEYGNAWIGYALNLRWLWFKVYVHQSLLSKKDASTEVQFVRAKKKGDIQLAPEASRYKCGLFEIHARPLKTPPIVETLYTHHSKNVVWNCLHPNAILDVKLNGTAPFTGQGYVEQLSMTLPPWQLPIQVLHWGRFVSARHSLVWIRWQQQEGSTQWVFFNGKRQKHCDISSSHIHVKDENIHMDIRNPRTIVSGRPLENLSGKLGRIYRLMPSKLKQWEEVKWVAQGTLKLPQQPEEEGWVIHEEVRLADHFGRGVLSTV